GDLRSRRAQQGLWTWPAPAHGRRPCELSYPSRRDSLHRGPVGLRQDGTGKNATETRKTEQRRAVVHGATYRSGARCAPALPPSASCLSGSVLGLQPVFHDPLAAQEHVSPVRESPVAK